MSICERRASDLGHRTSASSEQGGKNSVLFEGKDRRELEKLMKQEGRLPPGQSLTLKWPVLHYGSVPSFDPARWDFQLRGLVGQPLRLKWDEFNKLPKVKTHSDFH